MHQPPKPPYISYGSLLLWLTWLYAYLLQMCFSMDFYTQCACFKTIALMGVRMFARIIDVFTHHYVLTIQYLKYLLLETSWTVVLGQIVIIVTLLLRKLLKYLLKTITWWVLLCGMYRGLVT